MKVDLKEMTLEKVANHLGWVNIRGKSPIEIPNIGRDELAQFFHTCGFTVGAEIGVEQGKYALELCRRNPGLKLHCVDAWAPYKDYRDHVTETKLESFYQITRERLQSYDVVYHRKFSVDASKDFKDGSLDFVFVDANHSLPHVIADLAAWVPKVRSGGVVSGHDYCRRKQSGYQVHVCEAVHAWTQAYFVEPWFILGSKDVKDGQVRDRPRSWFWVQP